MDTMSTSGVRRPRDSPQGPAGPAWTQLEAGDKKVLTCVRFLCSGEELVPPASQAKVKCSVLDATDTGCQVDLI